MISITALRFLLAVLFVAPAMYLSLTGTGSQQASPRSELNASALSLDNNTDAAAERLAGLLGTWQIYDKGLRTITVRPDGTASMDVEISSIGVWLYGRRLSMDLVWCLSDEGVLSYSILGGNPERTVSRVMKNFGTDFQFRIVSMSDDVVELEDLQDPGTIYSWVGVEGTATIADASDTSGSTL